MSSALEVLRGVLFANPHLSIHGRRARGTSARTQISYGFKVEIDPDGLLNPGKMRSYFPVRP